ELLAFPDDQHRERLDHYLIQGDVQPTDDPDSDEDRQHDQQALQEAVADLVPGPAEACLPRLPTVSGRARWRSVGRLVVRNGMIHLGREIESPGKTNRSWGSPGRTTHASRPGRGRLNRPHDRSGLFAAVAQATPRASPGPPPGGSRWRT